MTINELLQQLGISGLDAVSNFQQQFAGDVDLNRFGRFLPQFNQGLFQQAFEAGTSDIAGQRALAAQDFQAGLQGNLFAGQTGLMGQQPVATGFSGSGAQQRQMQNLRQGAQQAFDADIYGMNRQRQDAERQFAGQEQDLFAALQQNILGFQGDTRQAILNLLRLDPTGNQSTPRPPIAPPTAPMPVPAGMQGMQDNLQDNFGEFNNVNFGDFDYESYYDNLFKSMNQGMI